MWGLILSLCSFSVSGLTECYIISMFHTPSMFISLIFRGLLPKGTLTMNAVKWSVLTKQDLSTVKRRHVQFRNCYYMLDGAVQKAPGPVDIWKLHIYSPPRPGRRRLSYPSSSLSRMRVNSVMLVLKSSDDAPAFTDLVGRQTRITWAAETNNSAIIHPSIRQSIYQSIFSTHFNFLGCRQLVPIFIEREAEGTIDRLQVHHRAT